MGNAQLKDFEDDGGDDAFVDELKPGTKLMHGQYEIVSFLNAGGFGITYLAKDSLDRKIVIKECFPGAFCRRSRTIVQARSRAHQSELKSIVRLFIEEARSLAKMDHPNIVGVHQVFEDNDTAYMALDYVEGRDLLDTLEDPNHGLTPEQIKSILTDVLGAVGFIHDQEILHRDISPDNILIDSKMRPVLIDFGAAREQASKQSRVLSALRVVKDGYSPQEFYIAGSEQNASSDLYALGASFYHLIANEVPPNSQARLAAIATGDKDPYVPLADRIKGYDRNFLAALDKSLRVLPKDRVQSAADWIEIMNGNAPVTVAPVTSTGDPQKPKSKMPMLMASVAVIALLGVGVLTQSDILAPASEPAVETAAVTEVEPVAPVVEEAIVSAEPVVEAPVAPEVAAAEVNPRPEARPENLNVVAAADPLPEPVVTPEIIEDTATIATLPGFLTNVEAPVDAPVPTLALPEAPADIAPVEIAVVTDLPAAVTGTELVPEPEFVPVTNLVETDDSIAGVPDREVTVVASAPEAIAEPEVPATPEVVEAPEETFFVQTAWTPELPFSASADQPNVIGEPAAVAPLWVEEGVIIQSVNGIAIESIDDIPMVLRENVDLADDTNVSVSFGIETDGVASTEDWSMPVRQEFRLLNGVGFAARPDGDAWTTFVTQIPQGVETELKLGDSLIAYIPNSQRIETRTALKDLFDNEIEAGTTQFSFAVNRDNSIWVAGLEFVANPEND